MRVLTSLNKDQMRLGYLNCLVLVAGRQLDSHAGLLRRFEDFVLRKITPDDPTYQKHMLLIGQKRSMQRGLGLARKTKEAEKSVLRHSDSLQSSYYLHELWLRHTAMDDAIGGIAKGSCHQILKFARNMGLVGASYSLTELGILLRGFLLDTNSEFSKGLPDLNPFLLWKRTSVALTLLYTLLQADIVIPFLVALYAEESIASGRKGTSEQKWTSKATTNTTPIDSVSRRQASDKVPERQAMYLVQALDKLIENLDKDLPIGEALVLKEISQFRSRLEENWKEGADKIIFNTERLKNHFYPRRQHLVDLGFLKRMREATAGEQLFVATPATFRAASVWRDLRAHPFKQESLIERSFFSWSSEIYGLSAERTENNLKRLDYFARGFPLVSREIGFTPGRTVALSGCLLAIEEGIIIEVDDMFEMMSEMAKGPYRPYLHYSGGSRLDREFLIRVDVGPLRERLKQEGLRKKFSQG